MMYKLSWTLIYIFIKHDKHDLFWYGQDALYSCKIAQYMTTLQTISCIDKLKWLESPAPHMRAKVSFSYPFFSQESWETRGKHQVESQILKDSMHTGCANSHVVTRVVYREACDHHGSSPCDVRPGSHCLQPSENSLNKTMKSAWNSDEILHKIYKICTVAPSNFYKTGDVTQTLDSEVWAKSICHCFDVLRPACGSSPQASPALSRRWEGLFWLAHTCLCAVTITNVSRHLCEEVTSLEVGWIMSLELSCLLLSLARGSFWYKCPLCTFDCENFSPGSLHPMATSSSSNKMEQQPPDWALLQLDVATNQVNWSHVRLYMTERFSHPPTAFVQRQNTSLHEHVDRSQICDHILRMRPCPSFFDAYQPCKMFHPEFILQNDILLWTPRTWPCHAYQRRRDLWNRCWNCEIPHCGQLHRQGWEHSEMFGFRAWIASVEPRFWYSVYCLEPNFSGRLPLYTIDFQDLQTCLATQPFITTELHSKHDWKDSVPSPPTYIIEVPSRVQPLASNFNEPERVHNRKMRNRDTTPRGQRPTQSEVPPHRRDPFLSAQIPSDHVQSCPSPRFGPGTPPRSRQPTGSENSLCLLPLQALRSVLAPRPPPRTHMDLNALPHHWRTRCQLHHHHMLPCLSTMADSDPDLPLPPASLKISPKRSKLVHQAHSITSVPRSSCLYDGWIREVRPVRWLATSIPPPWRQLQCLQVLQPRPGIQRRHDWLGSVVPPKIPPFQPRWVRGTDPDHPATNEHRRPRTRHSDQLLLHEDAEGAISGLLPLYSEPTNHHTDPAPRLAQICRWPLPACTHPTRCCTTIQQQRRHCGPWHHQCQHPTSPTELGRLRPQYYRGPRHIPLAILQPRGQCYFHLTYFRGCWLQARINPGSLFTVLPFRRSLTPGEDRPKNTLSRFHFWRSLTPGEDRPPLRTFSFDMWLCIITPLFPAMFFSVCRWSRFGWLCCSSMTRPRHTVPTILHTGLLSTPLSANREKMNVCCYNRRSHTTFLSVPDGQRPRTRQCSHLWFKTFRTVRLYMDMHVPEWTSPFFPFQPPLLIPYC